MDLVTMFKNYFKHRNMCLDEYINSVDVQKIKK